MNTLKRFMLPVFLLGVATGCATPRYVLHWREPTTIGNLFQPPAEAAPISSQQDVALLYDRSRWVVQESVLSDGSAWVHYAIVLKNTGARPVAPQVAQARIEDADGNQALAELTNEEKQDACKTIDARTLCRVEVKFKLPPPMVKRHGGSTRPLHLAVPIQDVAVLRQEVWLWEN